MMTVKNPFHFSDGSMSTVKWVKEEKIPIENERTRNAIKYLKSIPTLRTINIEYTNGIREY